MLSLPINYLYGTDTFHNYVKFVGVENQLDLSPVVRPFIKMQS